MCVLIQPRLQNGGVFVVQCNHRHHDSNLALPEAPSSAQAPAPQILQVGFWPLCTAMHNSYIFVKLQIVFL